MSYTLYHYVHCPFCIRVRMAFGYLKIPYISQVLDYDDEKTPVELTGKKMLPILRHESGAMNESLDIISFIDTENQLKVSQVINSLQFKKFESLLTHLGETVHSLCMPQWIYTKEFNEKSRNYFQKKKEVKRGPFRELIKNQNQFITVLEKEWPQIINDLQPFYQSSEFSLYDILLASHLWGLYIVPEFQFPDELHQYLQKVKKICGFNYHEDLWR